MKVWYILSTTGTAPDGSDNTKVINTHSADRDAAYEQMHRMLDENPRLALIAGLAEDQDGEPKEYDEVTEILA